MPWVLVSFFFFRLNSGIEENGLFDNVVSPIDLLFFYRKINSAGRISER